MMVNDTLSFEKLILVTLLNWVLFSMTLAGILQLVGLFCVLRAFYALLTILRIHFVKLDSSWASRFGSNPWAVVTGCTGGIGKEFCYLLAQLGFNIVMLARN